LQVGTTSRNSCRNRIQILRETPSRTKTETETQQGDERETLLVTDYRGGKNTRFKYFYTFH